MLAHLGKIGVFGFLGLCALVNSAPVGALPLGVRDAGPATSVAYQTSTRSRRAAQRRRASPSAVERTAEGGRYFVEFRARYALSYGHTFAAFGRLDSRGNIGQFEVAGLHPAGDSSVPWMMGHLLPVPSETGPSDGDLDPKYISARYRVTMNEAEYTKVVAKIREMQASTPLWSATMYNCNSFVGDIARYMGLKANVSTMQVPPEYINSLKAANNGQSVIAAGTL